MLLKRNFIVLTCLVVLLAGLIACGGGSPAQKIIGKWQGDIDMFKNSPDYKELEKNPMAASMAKIFLDMIGNMKMEITKDTMTVEVDFMGQKKKETSKYKVISTTADSVVVENAGGKNPSTKSTITIIDSKHIKITEEGKKGQPVLIFKKI